jgi:hypothetical protein
MRARWTGRLPVVSLAVLALLVTGGLGGTPASSALAATASASTRIESAWTTAVGTRGANGSATVRAFDTARGSVILSLRRLTPSARYAVVIRRGACGSLGTRVAAVGTFTATKAGALSATAPLTTAQVAAVRDAAVGTSRVSLVAGSGSRARCGTFVRSLAVTPQIWFGPAPLRLGRWTDELLFAANDPWPRVAGRTHVFVLDPAWAGPHTTTAKLRRIIDALEARQIRIALDWYALMPEDGCGVGVNGFQTEGGGGWEGVTYGADGLLVVLRRIRSVGGTVSFVSINEPFSGGVLWDGPNACHWSTATVAKKVAAFVKAVHAEFPAIEIGLIEGYNGPPWVDYVKEWIAAYEAAVGERLPFFHLDRDYTVRGWPDDTAQIQAYVRSRGTRFGLYYSTWPPPETNAEWFAGATAGVKAFEVEGAGPPDDALFQVWTEKPDVFVPETGATTMTRLIADYIRTRTTATVAGTPASTGGTMGVTGSVRTLGGDPVAGGTVAVTATPRDGPYKVVEFRGTVPADARVALVTIGVNREGFGPGTADLTFYEVGYAEGDAGANLVPNARFELGLANWDETTGDGNLTLLPSDRGSGSMMRMAVTPSQSLYSASGSFAVTPGAAYRLWAAVRASETSPGTAYLAPMFFTADWTTKVRQDIHPLGPVPTVGTTVTDATGAYALTMSPLEAGHYSLLAEYPGNATYWPARARTEVTVP